MTVQETQTFEFSIMSLARSSINQIQSQSINQRGESINQPSPKNRLIRQHCVQFPLLRLLLSSLALSLPISSPNHRHSFELLPCVFFFLLLFVVFFVLDDAARVERSFVDSQNESPRSAPGSTCATSGFRFRLPPSTQSTSSTLSSSSFFSLNPLSAQQLPPSS